mgnify:CR=1 FL=1
MVISEREKWFGGGSLEWEIDEIHLVAVSCRVV